MASQRCDGRRLETFLAAWIVSLSSLASATYRQGPGHVTPDEKKRQRQGPQLRTDHSERQAKATLNHE
jgi:hypothetical protein